MSPTIILQVIIGLIFIFWLFSMIASGINEFIASKLNLRSKYLLEGLRSMLDNDRNLRLFLGHPLIQSMQQGPTKPPEVSDEPLSKEELKKLKEDAPSYLSAAIVSRVMVDLFVTDSGAQTTALTLGKADGPLAGSLQSLGTTLSTTASAFRAEVEQWFNAEMDRVTGWYKRHVKKIVLVIALVLVLVANVDLIAISRTLYNDPASRQILVDQADKVVACKKGEDCKASSDLNSLGGTVSQLPSLGLFWTSSVPPCQPPVDSTGVLSTECGSWRQTHDLTSPGDVALKVLGLLIAWQAIALGAPFWFGLLCRFISLRNAGKTPFEDPAPAQG